MKMTALVLQGGGALGAYEYGVVRALRDAGRLAELRVVTGVSSGALNAAVLVGGRDPDPLATLDEMWRRFAVIDLPLLPQVVQQRLAVLGNAAMYRLRPDYLLTPLLVDSIYDTAPLRQTMSELIDFDRLNAPGSPRVGLTAVDVAAGKLVVFDNQTGLTLDQVIAAASLPPSFPMTRVGERWYYDSGLFLNNPLKPAIELLEQLAQNQADAEWEIIVVELFPEQAPIPTRLLDVVDRSIELVFGSKLQLDEQMLQRMNQYVDLAATIRRVLPPEPRYREILEHPALLWLQQHRRIERFFKISYRDPEAVSGPTDFSRATLERRIEAGYRDATRQLAQWPV